MTSLSVSEIRPTATTVGLRTGPLVLCAVLVGLVLSWARVDAVWHTGAFFDSDDAMRLVQVRDLLAGQGWFDMTAYRLDPPGGVFSHWSRIVDLPLAMLIRVFATLAPVETAERLARLAFPLAMQAALLFAMARLATLLMDRRAGALAILLGLLSGIVFGQFQPGRIDHHAPQIVLLVAMLGHLVAAHAPGRAREAAASAALAALSLGISLENLPFILAFTALLGARWIMRGNAAAAQMRCYAAGLATALPLVLAATVAPARWTLGVPDALSATHLVAGVLGALVLAGLPFAAGPPEAIGRRVMLATFGACLVLAATAWLVPGGLHEPFHGLDPRVRALWLQNVREVWTLARLWREDWFNAASSTLPLLFGALGILAAAWRSDGRTRLGWLFVAAALAIGMALSLLAVRVLTFAGPLAVFGGVACVLCWHDGLARHGRSRLAALSILAVLPFSSLGWSLALVLATSDETPVHAGGDCLAPSALAPLAALPPGLVVAPIDVGAHLLATSPHAVVAAPYHRNNEGNRRALDVLIGAPETAAPPAARGIRYIFTCDDLAETGVLTTQAPTGLAAALAAGRVPAWLTPIPLQGTPFRAFAVAPEPSPDGR